MLKSKADDPKPDPTWTEIDAYTADFAGGIYGWLAAGIRHDHRSLRDDAERRA